MALLFALGLMAKPMLVTVPFVLLLLDYWPLGRWRADRATGSAWSGAAPTPLRLVIEKLPLLALAAAASVATILAQSEAMKMNTYVSLPWRLGNTLVSYVAYLGQLFCPLGLAVFYPHPENHLPVWKVAVAFLVLAGITFGALVSWRRPYLLVGWLWYLGMLVPAIGLVQVGFQAMADRYTYLPQIGLSIALAWGVADVSRSWPCRRWVCGIGSALVVASLMACAWLQTSYWRDSETLWTHAVACTSQNAKAHTYLGMALGDLKRLDEAIAHFRQALEIKPDDADARSHLDSTLAQAVATRHPADLPFLPSAGCPAGRAAELASNDPDAFSVPTSPTTCPPRPARKSSAAPRRPARD